MCVHACICVFLSQCVCVRKRERECVLYAINLENMYI